MATVAIILSSVGGVDGGEIDAQKIVKGKLRVQTAQDLPSNQKRCVGGIIPWVETSTRGLASSGTGVQGAPRGSCSVFLFPTH